MLGGSLPARLKMLLCHAIRPHGIPYRPRRCNRMAADSLAQSVFPHRDITISPYTPSTLPVPSPVPLVSRCPPVAAPATPPSLHIVASPTLKAIQLLLRLFLLVPAHIRTRLPSTGTIHIFRAVPRLLRGTAKGSCHGHYTSLNPARPSSEASWCEVLNLRVWRWKAGWRG
jgi:hypothetical protein